MGDGVTVDFAFWHSATFNNAGTKVVFTDELGGGGSPVCNRTVGAEQGTNGIYDVVGKGAGRTLEFRSYGSPTRPTSRPMRAGAAAAHDCP